MPQVSRRTMNKQVEEKILALFTEVISDLTKKEEIEVFLLDFLSPTERTMLAKRLGIALLLSRGYGYEDISDLLKVSWDTVGRVSLWLKRSGKGFEVAIQKILAKEQKREFLISLEKLLAKMVSGHPAAWGRINRHYEQRKRNSKLW